MLKRLMALILAMTMVCGLIPANAFAVSAEEEYDASTEQAETEAPEPETEAEEETVAAAGSVTVQTDTVIYVNPRYQGVITENDLTWTGAVAASDEETTTFYTSVDALAVIVREAFAARQASIVVGYESAEDYGEGLGSDILEAALAHTGNAVEGDYLAWQYGGSQISTSTATYTDSDGNVTKYEYTVTYTPAYYTTAEQEAEMDTAVAELLSSLELDGKSDYEKIKAAYDYICANVTYDNANLEDDTYTLKYTAYAALVNKTAVCQGYSLLLYRLALEMGIDCRFIGGTGNGGAHGWNIVKLGDVYYNVDATWDAGETEYSYFLVCDANFGDHTRDDEFNTAEFNAAYPMAEADYTEEAAAEILYSGTCGTSLTWTLDSNGLLEISGSGAMENYTSASNVPWYAYRSSIKALKIGESVTTIGNYAFYNCVFITSVVIPDSVTTIGGYAFQYCYGLVSLDLGEGVTTIGGCAFYDCTALAGTLVLPEGLTSLNTYTFAGCKGLTGTLVIPSSMTRVSGYAFQNCSGLTGIEFREGLTSIASYAFYNCTGLTGELKLPNTLTTINSYAFQNCSGLTGDLVIPNSVTTIGQYAFYNCTGFDGTLTLSESLKSIESYTFFGCSGITGKLVIPDSVTLIRANAFYKMSSLTSVEIGANVATIYAGPFSGCTAITKVTFNGFTVPTGANYVLSGLSALEEVYVHSACYGDFMANAIGNLSGTQARVLCLEDVSEFLISDGVLCGYFGEGGDIVIPDGVESVGVGAFLNCTTVTSVVFPEGMTAIENYAFKNCTALTAISLPTSLTSIGTNVFYSCTALTGDLVIPDNVTSIGTYAFYGCSGFNGTLTLSQSLTSIGYGAFQGCSGFTGDLIIPDSVTTVGSGAFRSCVGFNGTLKLSESLTAITSYAFYDCNNITGELVIPDSVTSIGDQAFAYLRNVTSIVIGANVSTIGSQSTSGYNPFYLCTGVTQVTFKGLVPPTVKYNIYSNMSVLEKVYIPSEACAEYLNATYIMALVNTAQFACFDTDEDFIIQDGTLLLYQGNDSQVVIPEEVTIIGNRAFRNHSEITAITFPSSLTNIGDSAFQKCTGLVSFEFPDTLTTIGAGAFASCTGLVSIEFPDGLTSIGGSAFSGCTGLTGDLTIPAAVTSIGNSAFYQCTGLNGKLTIEPGEKTIGSYAFYECKKITGLELGDGITSIGAYAFYRCLAMTGELVIPDSVTSIGSDAFYYCSKITGELVIPDGVTNLTMRTFVGMKMTSIIFGESLEVIGTSGYTSNVYNPFYQCSAVTEVTFRSLTPPTLYGNPFCSMSGLQTVYVPAESYTAYAEALASYLPSTAQLVALDVETDFLIDEDGVLTAYQGDGGDVVIPDEVLAIGTGAFQNCTAMTSVTIPETVTRIDKNAFDGCTGLTSVTLPDAVVSIPDYAFNGCTGLTSIVFSDSLTDIGNYAFNGCTSLAGIAFPAALTSIGNRAFYGCTGLQGELKLPDGLLTIGTYAFYQCKNLTGDLVIPNSVTSMGTYAFAECKGFDGTLTLSESLTSIPAYAFNYCSGITGEIRIPDGVTQINNNAFSRMSKITSVTIGAKVEIVGTKSNTISSYGVFYNCPELKTITFNCETVPTFYGNPVGMNTGLETVYVPVEHHTAYVESLKSYLPAGARVIGIGATSDFLIEDGVLVAYYGLGGDVTIPEGVTAIGTSAFQNCTELTSVTFPASLTTVGDYAFAGCSGLGGKLVIPDSVETIGSYAFSGGTALTGLDLGNGVEDIQSYAFSGCTGMTGDLVIPDSVTALGEYAFENCSGFDGTLKLSGSLTAIQTGTFCGMSGISGELVIPDSVETIGMKAFQNMSAVTSVVFGAKVAQIGKDGATQPAYVPFLGCTAVTELAFTGLTPPTLYGNMFYSMSGLQRIYVSAEALDAYVEAFANYVDASLFSTDYLQARVTNLAAAKVYSQSVVLTWNPHTSEQVVGYTVLRDGEAVGTVSECTFTDRNLETQTSYIYTIQGYTEDGTTTGAAEIQVTTVMPEIRDIATSNGLNVIGVTQNHIYIYVADSGNLLPLGDEETIGKLYYLSGDEKILISEAEVNTSLSSTSTAVYTVEWDVAEMENGEYELLFELTDVDGNSAEYREAVTIDTSVPQQIVGVVAVSDVTVIYVNWSISAEVDTNTYRIYRRAQNDTEYQLIAQIKDRYTLSYTDANVRNDKIYYYYVTGVNDYGEESIPSLAAGATLADDTEAPLVTRLAPANASYVNGELILTMYSEDNVSVTKAQMYYSLDDGSTWTLLAEGNTGVFTAALDTTALPDGKLQVKGVAHDAAGNESNVLTYVYMIDNTGPEQVSGLSYVSTNVTLTLSWDDVSDEDIYYFSVEQKNADGSYSELTKVYDTLGLNIYDLTPGTAYTYRVVGYDKLGNRGTPSEDLTAMTQMDTIAPVVTAIRPTSGYYSERISVSVTATDEYGLQAIVLQVSADLLTWTEVYREAYSDIAASRTLEYDLSLADYPEGYLYVRGIAIDAAGNMSDSGVDAPYVQHMVDRTAPAEPQNVAAAGKVGYIEISWDQGSESDLNMYYVYRAESEDGTYELINGDLTTLNCYDRNVEEGKVYYYKVAVSDAAGNLSQYSAVVSAGPEPDTEKPVIISVYPETGSVIGAGNHEVSVAAQDNHYLSSILIEYSGNGVVYKTLYELSAIDVYGEYAAAEIPLEEYSDGAAVYIRVTATDKSGNTSDAFLAQYTVDVTAPAVNDVSAVYDEDADKVSVSWTGGQEDDLEKYKVYRKTGMSGTYALLKQCAPVAGQSAYTVEDTSISDEKVTYYYRVDAVDRYGNVASMVSQAVELPDRSAPVPVISCDYTMAMGVEYYIDASRSTDNSEIVSYYFDFGDGTTSTEKKPVHVYEEMGDYVITLTVTDDDGNVSTCTRNVRIVERSAIGTVTIKIVDEYGTVVPGAPVYFDLGEEYQTVKVTDNSGCVTFTSVVGVHAVGCVIANNEWLPVKKDIIVTAGYDTTATMTLIHQTMLEGSFEVSRMTFEEIEAAGIDVSDPENQHIVRINVSLTYGTTEEDTSFIFNMTTKKTVASEPIIVETAEQTRLVIPTAFPVGDEGEVAIAYLDLPIGASFLKEFFSVNLHIVNNASTEFAMLNNVVTLNIPEGLTLVQTDNTAGSPVVSIDEVPGQSSATVSWILRGDQEGSYQLTADYSGVLAEFDEEIFTTFVSEEPIVVYGMSAVKMIAEVNTSVNYDAFYFNLSLENVSDIDVNLPSIEIIDNVLSTYLTYVTEDMESEESTEGTYSAPSAKLLNTLLENASGYSQYIGTDTAVTNLTPGEKLTKKYAVYNVAGYDNVMRLQEAIYDITEGYGIQFEIIQTDMDLFSMDNAAEKLAEISGEKYEMYAYVLGNQNFFYVMEAVNRDEDILADISADRFDTARSLMDLDGAYARDETRIIARELVGQLFIDEAMQQTIDSAVNVRYYGITESLLSGISARLENEASVTSEDITAFADYCGNSGNVRSLALKLESEGLSGFAEQLLTACEGLEISAEAVTAIQSVTQDDTLQNVMVQELTAACAGISDVIAHIDAVYADWYEAEELVDSLITVAASQEEADGLLDMLCEFTAADSAIYAELVAIRDSIDSANAERAERFCGELTAAQVQAADSEIDTIMEHLDDCYGCIAGALYSIVKIEYGELDIVFDWDGSISDLHVLRVLTEFSFALSEAVQKYGLNAPADEEALHTLKALKYLIKTRLIGERSFAYACGKRSESAQRETLDWINETLGTAYAAVDEYADNVMAQLLEYRDSMFATYYTTLDVPEAPVVTINYLKNSTNEQFASTYEYSFDGVTWNTCAGAEIAFEPGTVPKSLRVRTKETAESFAGNVTKITIPAKPRITGDVTVTIVDSGYVLEGLPAGTYQYVFVNERAAEELTETITVEDGKSITILSDEDWIFMALRMPASETAFASQIRYVVTEQPWTFYTDKMVLAGIKEKTTSTAIETYYSDRGTEVTVTAADGSETDMAGTGSLITVNDETYQIVVFGDVDGNAEVNVIDLIGVADHIEGDELLEGAYQLASLSDVSGEDEETSVVDLANICDVITEASE